MFEEYGADQKYVSGSGVLPPGYELPEGHYLSYHDHIYHSPVRAPAFAVLNEMAEGTAKAMTDWGHYFIRVTGTDVKAVKDVIRRLEMALGGVEITAETVATSEEGITKPTNLAEANDLFEKAIGWVQQFLGEFSQQQIAYLQDSYHGSRRDSGSMSGFGPEAIAKMMEEIERDDDLGFNPDRDFEWSDQV